MPKKYLYGLLLLGVFTLFGCAKPPPVAVPMPVPEVEPRPVAEPLPEPEEPPPTVRPDFDPDELLRFVAAEEQNLTPRLAYYQAKRQEWHQLATALAELVPREQWPAGWSQCLAQLDQVADDFELAREKLRDLEWEAGGSWSGAVAALSTAYRADREFVAGDCGTYHRLAKKTVAARLDQFHEVASEQLQAVLQHYASRGKASEVRQTLEEWRWIYPDRILPFALLQEISLALFRAGERDPALSLLAEQEKAMAVAMMDTSAVSRLRGDLLLVAGRSDEALSQYEQIAARYAAAEEQRQWVDDQLRLLRGQIPASREERSLFMALLEDAVLFDGRAIPAGMQQRMQRLEERFPAGILTFRARLLADEVERQSQAWFAGQLGRVEESLAEGAFDEAVAVLGALLRENLSREQEGQVRQMLTEAEESRRVAAERRRQLEQQALSIQWEEANRLLGLGQYDEAITLFARLLESEYREEARQRMAEAAREAATELRRQAASLFVRARRSDEPEQAVELAGESWQLLRRIISRYPDSDIIDRVMDNLASVEDYLEGLAPGLLKELRERSEAVGNPELFDNE
ncbi:hypothetical protein DaAHT2_1688 [Desulfurivibrio alkaliphilus AHT 2]|uniref:Tetratricopeptide repeat protein n=1 Tax=Desulfurivibrio alkaliphilus (strain DSM 19089 / UNIQEM U267 / AHT2) TaxID=589865 RepID=D6Z4A5_DESAT|nr:hypothetical protein DaAHT2_1688 [Desulfurivibrio alkaliphilus AHT 2]